MLINASNFEVMRITFQNQLSLAKACCDFRLQRANGHFNERFSSEDDEQLQLQMFHL